MIVLVVRKRRGEGNMEDVNVRVIVIEYIEVKEIKRMYFFFVESEILIVKRTEKVIIFVSKRISNREKLSLRKKSGEFCL